MNNGFAVRISSLVMVYLASFQIYTIIGFRELFGLTGTMG